MLIYQNVHIMEQSLEGNIDYFDEKTLVGLSGHVFKQYLLENDSHAVDNFIGANKAGLASTSLAEIKVAAARGVPPQIPILTHKPS